MALEGDVGCTVYIISLTLAKVLNICMNGRIFLAGVVMNSAKTFGQKVGGSRIGEPVVQKVWGGGSGPAAQ